MTKAEYAAYLQSPHWRSLRLWALERAEKRCQLCSASGTTLDVHHNNYDRVGHERPSDLIVLCRKCHERHHEKVKPLAAPAKNGRTDVGDFTRIRTSWPDVLDDIRERSPMLHALMEPSRPTVLGDDGALTLTWPQSAEFYRHKADDPKNREQVIAAIRSVTGHTVRLEYRTEPAHIAYCPRCHNDAPEVNVAAREQFNDTACQHCGRVVQMWVRDPRWTAQQMVTWDLGTCPDGRDHTYAVREQGESSDGTPYEVGECARCGMSEVGHRGWIAKGKAT